MLVVLTALGVVWAAVVLLVLTLCVIAARADAPPPTSAADQSPRRPSTWGTVRKRIFTSPQSDQLATYK
jgi:hypothetical protein